MSETENRLQSIVRVFEELFRESFRVQLVAGGEEPLYVPPGANGDLGRIVFTRDYVSSALHEVAHWCIAGAVRREHVDYNYWYYADGRSQAQQLEFEAVEVKPQALEWIFSVAMGVRFRVSLDNLSGAAPDSRLFKERVVEQARIYVGAGMPRRAEQFATALMGLNSRRCFPQASEFTIEGLA